MPPRDHAPRRHVPSSAVAGFLDPAQVAATLRDWVADEHDREFLVRCLIGEGPAHHRGANYVLLRLLDIVRSKLGAPAVPLDDTVPVPLRLPPHLESSVEHSAYPLGLSVSALERLAPRGSREVEAMVDCLTDGPPQHAIANVHMVNVLESILRALDDRPR